MPGNAPMPGAGAAQFYGGGNGVGAGGGRPPTNLGDILERVLDKGLVIAGDIQVNLLDIELLTIKLRLVIASLDTAREVGINWWENDPWLNAAAGRQAVEGTRDGHGELDDGGIGELREEIGRLRGRIKELESGQ
ncbi:MAG TPA: gas vesicle protein [Trebonia sp.]